MRLAFLAAVAVAVLLAIPTISGNHPQPLQSGNTITFAEKTGGNEWWVEVKVTTTGGVAVSKVEVMDDGGPWSAMTFHADWGTWALGYHVEPGHQVHFRATASGEVVASCPFTHPSAVETCPHGQPTQTMNGWTSTYMGDTGPSSSHGDMAIADVTNDGRADVVTASSTGISVFMRSTQADGWNWALVSQRPSFAMAAGDGDGDGTKEIYALSNGVLYADTGNGISWSEQALLTFPDPSAGDMTLGNLDGVAGPELYVGTYDAVCDNQGICTYTSHVYMVRKTATWSSTLIATLDGHIDSMWIGDGDADGTSELYVGHGTRHADRASQVKLVGGVWQTRELPGDGSDSGQGLVVAGDGDRDGKGEVYVANYYGVLRKLTYDATTDNWTATALWDQFNPMPRPEGGHLSPTSLFLGDADSDGTNELYIATDLGELYQARWSGTAWQLERMSYPQDPFRGHGTSAMLAVGDGDSNGRREAYLTASFQPTGDGGATHTYLVEKPVATFGGTFTKVRGNEYWVQANVAATGGTLSKVDVRLNDGAWKPLAKQSWGGWAASVHAVQGTVIQMRATSTAAGTGLSDCYKWIPAKDVDATKTACAGAPPPPPPQPTITFSSVKGNEHWFEAVIKGDEPIGPAWLYFNDCTNEPSDLSYRADWGKWVTGVSIPSGTKVVIEAYGAHGPQRSGGYVWPNATPTSGCPP